MDIRKLQRAIVDGLEDTKAQDIRVFDTEHLSPLFERVIVASGASRRQTRALAASVRDSVKSKDMQVLRTEGEDNGEWIIVDCGAAVAHIMQPGIRDYYHLEEIWGDKPVKVKLDTKVKGLVKAAEPDKSPRKTAAVKSAPKKSGVVPKKVAAGKVPARKVPAKKAPAKKAPTKRVVSRTVGVKKAVAKVARKVAAPARKAAAPRSGR